MMVFLWIRLAFCSFAIAFALSTEGTLEVEVDQDLADYLREAIENFRSQMTEGIPEINMPVLDPLHLEDMDIDVNENVATMQLHINEMVVNGLSTFTLNGIEPNLEEFYIHLNISLPGIFIFGEYSLNGRLMSIFPIHGNGNYSINATGINISGNGQVHFTPNSIQMDLLILNLGFERIAMDLGRNFLGGGRFGEVMQEIIPGVGRDIFNLYKPLILRKLQTALTAKINEELNKPEVKDIIHDIVPINH